MKIIMVITAIATIAIAGCAANTGIVKISDDTYMYAKQDGFTPSGATIKVQLYKDANAFCAKNGEKFSPVSDKSEDQEYGKFSSAEIHFKCE